MGAFSFAVELVPFSWVVGLGQAAATISRKTQKRFSPSEGDP